MTWIEFKAKSFWGKVDEIFGVVFNFAFCLFFYAIIIATILIIVVAYISLWQ